VEHIGPQFLLALEGVEVLTVDHMLGDAELLVHALDHDALVDALVGTADEVAVEVKVHIIHGLDERQRLVDEDVVYVEGMLGQHHAALAQHLSAVHD